MSKQILFRFAVAALLGAVAAGGHAWAGEVVSSADLGKLLQQANETELSMRWYDGLRERVREMHREADAIMETLESQGRADEALRFEKAKRKVVMLHRDMPSRRRGFLATIQEMVNYRDQTLPSTVKQLQEISDLVNEYNAKIESGELKPLAPDEAAAASEAAEEMAWENAGYEVYISGLSGDVDFYIDGEKVTRVGQTLPADESGDIPVKAMVMGPQRERALNFKPRESVISWDSDPYFLNYKASLPGGRTGETTWEVMAEEYDWDVSTSNPDGSWEIQDEGLPGVKRDTVLLHAPRAMTFKINVSGQADWKTTYKTHGNPIERTDEGAGSVSVSLTPR
jgi:hypothetical protein